MATRSDQHEVGRDGLGVMTMKPLHAEPATGLVVCRADEHQCAGRFEPGVGHAAKCNRSGGRLVESGQRAATPHLTFDTLAAERVALPSPRVGRCDIEVGMDQHRRRRRIGSFDPGNEVVASRLGGVALDVDAGPLEDSDQRVDVARLLRLARTRVDATIRDQRRQKVSRFLGQVAAG